MAEFKIGRYRVFGANGHFIVSRWDGMDWQVLYAVPTYSTFDGAIKKAKQLHNQDTSGVFN